MSFGWCDEPISMYEQHVSHNALWIFVYTENRQHISGVGVRHGEEQEKDIKEGQGDKRRSRTSRT